ncbi:MAG: hypothetical protein PS018_27930 [bacterium]|nr:hypothetical protein [bacterium]
MSMLLAAMVALNPVGLDFLRSAFLADEALTRNIARPIVLTGLAIAALAVALEWLFRVYVLKRRRRGTTTA